MKVVAYNSCGDLSLLVQCTFMIHKVCAEKNTDNFCVWPFYNQCRPLFCQLHKYLSQNLDSDVHFELLNMWKIGLDFYLSILRTSILDLSQPLHISRANLTNFVLR